VNIPELNRRFDYHAPDAGRVAAHQEVRTAAKAFAFVLTNLPEGREKALAFTALEESTFWANAAIAREGE
jgi:plasmid stabilization system protein ParE